MCHSTSAATVAQWLAYHPFAGIHLGGRRTQVQQAKRQWQSCSPGQKQALKMCMITKATPHMTDITICSTVLYPEAVP